MEQKRQHGLGRNWLETVFCSNFDVYEKLINFLKKKVLPCGGIFHVVKNRRIFRAATADEPIKKAK